MRKFLPVLTLVSAGLLLSACQAPEPYIAHSFAPNAQIQRAWNRVDQKDIGVEQVRVVNLDDLGCAGQRLPIPGEENFRTLNAAVASYWKDAFVAYMQAAGSYNEKDPKVKLYNLIDSVKVIAEPTVLQWRFNMQIISSNGSVMKEEIAYNAPTDGIKNMRDGCARLAQVFDKAVAWSILKTVSDPKFNQLVQPGLGFVPTMKAQSLTKTLNPFSKEDEDEYWKAKPN